MNYFWDKPKTAICIHKSHGYKCWCLNVWHDALFSNKVRIFWEGHKILRNLHLTFVYSTYRQKQGGDFAKFCGLLRIYELYLCSCIITFLTNQRETKKIYQPFACSKFREPLRYILALKFRYSKKGTKIWKNIPL